MANHDDSPMRRLAPRERRALEHLQQMGGLVEPEPPLPPEERDDFAVALGWTPEPFPLSVFPEKIADFARAVARTANSTADAAACGILAAAGAALGSARSIQVAGDFVDFAAVYLLVSGGSSSGKSPALSDAFAPVKELDLALRRKFLDAMAAYQRELVEHEKRVSQWKKADGTSPVPIAPVKPPEERILMKNLTLAALAEGLRDSPRGICLRYDELAGWLKDMNRYTSSGGGDRESYLEAWNYEMIKISRKGTYDKGDILIERPFLSVCGNVVPGALAELVQEAWKNDDGFLNRFLICTLRNVPASRTPPPPVPLDLAKHYREAIHRLRERVQMPGSPPGDAEGDTPYAPLPSPLPTDGRLCLDGEAREVYEAWYAALADEINDPNFDESLRSAYGKLYSYWARLCLTLYAIRWASDEPVFDGADQTIREIDPQFTGPIDALTATRTTELVRFFATQARYVRGLAAVPAQEKLLTKVVAWIKRRGAAEIQVRDVRQQFTTDPELATPEQVLIVLESLVTRGILQRIPPTGRQRTPRYLLIQEK